MKSYFFILVAKLLFCFSPIVGQNSFAASGNEGLSASSLQARLHVVSPVSGQSTIMAIGGDINFRLVSRQALTYKTDGAVLTELNLEYGTIRNLGIRFYRGWTVTGSFLSFSTDAGFERMRIVTNRNVRIGNGYPRAKVDANGTIRTREVNVPNTSWTDYVFDPAYKPIPLTELKNFIVAERQLPKIPNSSEVGIKGVNLAVVNIILL